jgi:hypothetical protein
VPPIEIMAGREKGGLSRLGERHETEEKTKSGLAERCVAEQWSLGTRGWGSGLGMVCKPLALGRPEGTLAFCDLFKIIQTILI